MERRSRRPTRVPAGSSHNTLATTPTDSTTQTMANARNAALIDSLGRAVAAAQAQSDATGNYPSRSVRVIDGLLTLGEGQRIGLFARDRYLRDTPLVGLTNNPGTRAHEERDEINLAPPTMQGMAQQLILDRRVGSYTVPENWFIWAAGNRSEDRAAVFDMPAPLANRFLHLQVQPDFESFKDYALATGVHEQIVAFLDAVGVDRCVIAGGSLGGNLALGAIAAGVPARGPRRRGILGGRKRPASDGNARPPGLGSGGRAFSAVRSRRLRGRP